MRMLRQQNLHHVIFRRRRNYPPPASTQSLILPRESSRRTFYATPSVYNDNNDTYDDAWKKWISPSRPLGSSVTSITYSAMNEPLLKTNEEEMKKIKETDAEAGMEDMSFLDLDDLDLEYLKYMGVDIPTDAEKDTDNDMDVDLQTFHDEKLTNSTKEKNDEESKNHTFDEKLQSRIRRLAILIFILLTLSDLDRSLTDLLRLGAFIIVCNTIVDPNEHSPVATLMHMKIKRDNRLFDIANPEFKRAIESLSFLFEKFKVKQEDPLHQSRTACVLKAKVDVVPTLPNSDNSHHNTKKKLVALKCMRDYDQVMAELAGREGIDPNSVLGINTVYVDTSLCTGDKLQQLQDAVDKCNTSLVQINDLVSDVSKYIKQRKMGGHKETREDEDAKYGFVLSIDFADRVLDTAIKHDRISSNPFIVKTILHDMIYGLDHLHTQNRAHCDIKPLNVVRTGERWRYIDMDVSCKFGDPFCSKSPSSGYCPPEVAKLLFSNDLKSYKGCKSFDFWSLGVIAFHLATGEGLFQTDGDDNVVERQEKELEEWNVYNIDDRLKKVKDSHLKDLLKKLLHHDPQERMSAFKGDIKNVLNEPFFNNTRDFTGLFNQQKFFSDQVDWEQKSQSSLCAAFAIDIANFKSLNDNTSHAIGDEALVHFASEMETKCEGLENAIPYHSGGDEYQILVECKGDEEDFKKEIEKLAKDLSTVVYNRSGIQCFLRIGVACFRGVVYDDADTTEHEVKAGIMQRRGLDAKGRDPVYDSDEKERFIVKFKKE